MLFLQAVFCFLFLRVYFIKKKINCAVLFCLLTDRRLRLPIDLLSGSKNTTWANNEFVDISERRNDQRIGSGITPVFGEDGYTVTL